MPHNALAVVSQYKLSGRELQKWKTALPIGPV